MVALERLLIGRTVGGRYAVEELIGRGRGGLVFRARDTDGGGEVALKVLATPQSAEARERYRRVVAGEVRLAAGIGHPNVVAAQAMGSDPELDLDFVAFELARGQTLASVLAQRGKPPISLGLRLLSDAADGLAAGHRAGLLHRDVRPASLYLVRSEAERQVRVKVGGFGIPQLVRRESLLAAPPEVSAYASPEMLANGSARLTPASDVFGLGVIGFQLMTGALPLDDAARRALADGRAQEVGVPFELSAAVPPHVFEAVLRALRIAPAERHADAGAFAEALREPASRSAVAVPAIFAAPESAPPAPRDEPAVGAAPVAAAPPAPEDAAEGATPPAEALQLIGVTPEVAAAAEPADTTPSTVDVAPPETFVALAGGAMSMDDAPAAAPIETPDTAVSASAEIEDLTASPAESEVVATPREVVPAVSAAVPTRSAPLPRAVPADLELYYPPQPATPPADVSHPGEVPAFPAATQTRIPAPVEGSFPVAAPVIATPAVAAAAPLPVPAKASAAAPVASRPVSIGGKRKPRAGAGAGGFRGSPAMAAGFVLGMLVLGTVGWMATRGPTGADAAATETLAANQLVPGAVTASAPTATALGSAPQTAAAPAPDTVAGSAEAREERRRALEEARKRLQDQARKKQQDEQARLALLQQQQAAAQAQPAAPPPAAARQPVAPPPVQQPVAVAQRPAAPPPAAPAAPPAAAPVREEPAPARAAASNEVYDVSDVEERPRLRNGAEIQRSLQSRYPEQLSAAQVSGSVMASFVVNPDGSVDGSSIRIVSSPNAAFNAPTQSVLRRARFRPATVKGQPVKVQVTMPVQWTAGQ